MKIYYLIILSALLIISCKKGEKIPIEPSPYWGEISAKKDGITWTASPYAILNINLNTGNHIDMSFDSITQGGILRESCGLYKVPLIKGTYPVVNTLISKKDSLVGGNFFYTEADILYGSYDILESDSSSFVTLLSYDSITKEVKGEFDLTFIVKYKPYKEAPDTIRLRNGTFHTRIFKN